MGRSIPKLIPVNNDAERREKQYGTILTTPEQIVREFRVGSRGVRIESVKEPVSKIERAIWIFFLIGFGWGFGYLHHFLTTKFW